MDMPTAIVVSVSIICTTVFAIVIVLKSMEKNNEDE